jgi:hypothetical protein
MATHSRFDPFLLLIFTIFLLSFTYLSTYTVVETSTITDDLTLTVSTDEAKYVKGQIIKIFGSVGSSNLDLSAQEPQVLIRVFHESSTVPVYETSFVSPYANFTHDGLKLEDAGKYRVDAVARANGSSAKSSAFFVVNDWLLSRPAFYMIGAMVSFAVLMFLIIFDMKKSIHSLEVYRFLCLSGIAVFPIVALVTADIAIGSDSTIGIVVKPPHNEEGQPILNEKGDPLPGGQWMLNIGGHQDNHFAHGIQIPLSVLVFGLAGGYIRYLYYTVFSRKTGSDVREKKFDTLEAIDRKKILLMEEQYSGVAQELDKHKRSSPHRSTTIEEELGIALNFIDKKNKKDKKTRQELMDYVDCKLLDKLKVEHLGLPILIEKYRVHEENELAKLKNKLRIIQETENELAKLKNKLKSLQNKVTKRFHLEKNSTVENELQTLRSKVGGLENMLNQLRNPTMRKNGDKTKEDLRIAKHVLIIRARRKFVLNDVLKDIKLFLLAPLLAIAVWFVLLQAEITNDYIIAVVSFTVGLVTEQVITTLTEFTSYILKGRKDGDKSAAKRVPQRSLSSSDIDERTEVDG